MVQTVTWDGAGPEGMISQLRQVSNANLAYAGQQIGQLALSRYVHGHRWQNRTHALETTIGVHVQVSGSLIVVTLYAGMYYGIYVETRWGGRYSSLMPALHAILPEAMAIANRALLGMR